MGKGSGKAASGSMASKPAASLRVGVSVANGSVSRRFGPLKEPLEAGPGPADLLAEGQLDKRKPAGGALVQLHREAGGGRPANERGEDPLGMRAPVQLGPFEAQPPRRLGHGA